MGKTAWQPYLSRVGAQQGVLTPAGRSVPGGLEVIAMATIKKTVRVLPGQTKKVRTGNVVWTIKRGR
ncbi:hypothetical protein MLIT_06910 [Mycolicibacterium litorale]|uniref:Uncharacterized protein n=1 Tax=Mycolicibacterium litorale TaxID=758802 RepID=A0AAD1IGK3_9MYCO|nr:hypothetical protein MLIT_06910 [Mycolicibacterium litorale]